MRDVLLVRYGEVFLKGANRPYFLRMLTENVRKAVKPVGGHVWLSEDVYKRQSTRFCIPLSSLRFGMRSFAKTQQTG